MKKFLIVDTETTGLPIVYDAPFTDVDNWPRILELSWELCWENGETIQKACDLIQPDGWRFPTGDFWKEHGFNEAESMLNGVDIIIALINLAVAMCCADVMVCHNLSYDKPIIECEMYRYSIYPKAVRRQLVEKKYCTRSRIKT
jgi:DNA polymerase-3 subunit alpha